MQSVIPITARWVHSVAFALWLGGLIAIGALAAPTTFHAVRSYPALSASPDLQNNLAGIIIGGAFRKFNVLCCFMGILMLLSDLALWSRSTSVFRKFTALSFVLSLLLLGTVAILGLYMFPALDVAQLQNNKPLFNSLHQQYVSLSYLQFPLLLAVALTVAIRDGKKGRDKF